MRESLNRCLRDVLLIVDAYIAKPKTPRLRAEAANGPTKSAEVSFERLTHTNTRRNA